MTDEARMAGDGCTQDDGLECKLCERRKPLGQIEVYWRTIEPGRHFSSVAVCEECRAVLRNANT